MLSQLQIYPSLLIFTLRIQNCKYFAFPSLQEHRPVMEYDTFYLTIMLEGPASGHVNLMTALRLIQGKKTPQTTSCAIHNERWIYQVVSQ